MPALFQPDSERDKKIRGWAVRRGNRKREHDGSAAAYERSATRIASMQIGVQDEPTLPLGLSSPAVREGLGGFLILRRL